MATNPYLNSFNEGVPSEQSLYEDLVIESIKMYGFDVVYIPRNIIAQDDILNEEIDSKFNEAYTIEMYLTELEGFEGEDFLSKFGLQVSDQCTLVVANKRWQELVGDVDNSVDQTRPYEGDLIYIPFSKTLFEIRFVEDQVPFFQLNKLPVYELRCELFQYESQDFDTGVTEIDSIEERFADTLSILLNSISGEFIIGEKIILENDDISINAELTAIDLGTAAGDIYKISNISYQSGEYDSITIGFNVSGVDSGAEGTVSKVYNIDDSDYKEYDNRYQDNSSYEQNKNSILDFSEDNPFGEL